MDAQYYWAVFNRRVSSLAKKHQEVATKWFREAAERGHAEAMALAGFNYEDGKTVIRDDEKAVRWFRESAEQGNALGQWQLATI